MDKETKREALKQYLHYFRIWFLALGLAIVVFAAVSIWNAISSQTGRGNSAAPAERVYDYADVLTPQEEDALRALIAKKEARIKCDLVLVTINEAVETENLSWEYNMRNRADDFYDQNNYGYDVIHGDGALLLDNWYEGQAGSWLSTCGAVYHRFSTRDIDDVLRQVSRRVEESPYEAYRAYVESVSEKMSRTGFGIPAGVVFVVPLIAFLLFVGLHMQNPAAKDTTTANVYVVGGKPAMREKSDQFIRKFVTTRHIERSSGGGGGSSSGGGGGHVSSGGVSHGGGGSRR